MVDLSEWPLAAKAALATLGAAALVAVWSVLASTIFLAGTGMIGQHHGLPFADWWLYWWFYGFHHPTVGLWLKLSAGLAIGVPLLLVVVGVARKGMPGSNRMLHGSTEWAKRSELRENDLLARFGGLYLGKLAARRFLRFGGPEHVACYAPTRSGKGVGLVIPNCLLYESSLVCLDVKKENFFVTAGIRAKAGQKVFLCSIRLPRMVARLDTIRCPTSVVARWTPLMTFSASRRCCSQRRKARTPFSPIAPGRLSRVPRPISGKRKTPTSPSGPSCACSPDLLLRPKCWKPWATAQRAAIPTPNRA